MRLIVSIIIVLCASFSRADTRFQISTERLSVDLSQLDLTAEKAKLSRDQKDLIALQAELFEALVVMNSQIDLSLANIDSTLRLTGIDPEAVSSHTLAKRSIAVFPVIFVLPLVGAVSVKTIGELTLLTAGAIYMYQHREELAKNLIDLQDSLTGLFSIGEGAFSFSEKKSFSVQEVLELRETLLQIRDLNEQAAFILHKTKSGKQKDGTPGNNVRQNKQAKDAARKHGLSKDQRERLHHMCSGEDYSYHELCELAKDIANGRW